MVLRNELRVTQSLRYPLAGTSRIDGHRADRHRPRESTAADLVARDHDRMLPQEASLERQARLRDGHGATLSSAASGTPANTSWWKSRRPNRSSGHVMIKALPTTLSMGTNPSP